MHRTGHRTAAQLYCQHHTRRTSCAKGYSSQAHDSTLGIFVSMTSAPATGSVAARMTARVSDELSKGPASADPKGIPAKLRLIEMANARPNHARWVRRWRSENTVTFSGPS